MANFNKTLMLARLGADPEAKVFQGGGKVCSLRVCVNNRKKNRQSGEWEDSPCWIDAEVWNKGEGKMADVAEQYLKKGSAVFLEGHLEQDEWQDKATGQKRSKHKLVVDSIQLIDSKQGGADAPQRRERVPSVDEPSVFPETPTAKSAEIPFSWLLPFGLAWLTAMIG